LKQSTAGRKEKASDPDHLFGQSLELEKVGIVIEKEVKNRLLLLVVKARKSLSGFLAGEIRDAKRLSTLSEEKNLKSGEGEETVFGKEFSLSKCAKKTRRVAVFEQSGKSELISVEPRGRIGPG